MIRRRRRRRRRRYRFSIMGLTMIQKQEAIMPSSQ